MQKRSQFATIHEAGQFILRREGTALPAQVIAERIEDEGLYRSAAPDRAAAVRSVETTLQSYIRRSQPKLPLSARIFTREKGPDPRSGRSVLLLGLAEWRNDRAVTEPRKAVPESEPVQLAIVVDETVHAVAKLLVDAGKCRSLGEAVLYLAREGAKARQDDLRRLRDGYEQLRRLREGL